MRGSLALIIVSYTNLLERMNEAGECSPGRDCNLANCDDLVTVSLWSEVRGLRKQRLWLDYLLFSLL